MTPSWMAFTPDLTVLERAVGLPARLLAHADVRNLITIRRRRSQLRWATAFF